LIAAPAAPRPAPSGSGSTTCAPTSTSPSRPTHCSAKISLDLFWLKDDSLLDSDNLPEPDLIAAEIADDLRSALEQMEAILTDQR
jgi:type I restriction enzyme M protein